MYIEQKATFLTGKYKKMHGKQKSKVKSTGKTWKSMVKQIYKGIITQ